MKKAVIWHNPRCSKSRQGLALLEDMAQRKDIEIEVRKYLDDVPSRKEIADLLTKLDIQASGLIRKKEALFKSLALKGVDEDALLDAMAEHAKLIERPVVISGEKAAIGRPPEDLLSIFVKGD